MWKEQEKLAYFLKKEHDLRKSFLDSYGDIIPNDFLPELEYYPIS